MSRIHIHWTKTTGGLHGCSGIQRRGRPGYAGRREMESLFGVALSWLKVRSSVTLKIETGAKCAVAYARKLSTLGS